MIKCVEEFKHTITNGSLTRKVLEILLNMDSIYFNAKKIRFELYNQNGISLRGRSSTTLNITNDLHLKMMLSCRIGHITRKLKKHGYIEKVSRNTWKKIKEIDIEDNRLYPNEKKEEKTS